LHYGEKALPVHAKPAVALLKQGCYKMRFSRLTELCLLVITFLKGNNKILVKNTVLVAVGTDMQRSLAVASGQMNCKGVNERLIIIIIIISGNNTRTTLNRFFTKNCHTRNITYHKESATS
jgi:hypothetical protein